MQTKKVSSIFNMYRSRNYPRNNLKLFSHHCEAGTNGKTNYIITCLFRKLKQPKEKSFISLDKTCLQYLAVLKNPKEP